MSRFSPPVLICMALFAAAVVWNMVDAHRRGATPGMVALLGLTGAVILGYAAYLLRPRSRV